MYCHVIVYIARSFLKLGSDRDCSLSGGRYKLFRIIAESLAEHGVAGLRYDSPGVGGSTGDWNQRTLSDGADEISNEIQVLKRNANIGSRRIGLLGISQGSDLASVVAGSNRDVAFVVLLWPHAKPLREDFLTFRAYLLKEDGVAVWKIMSKAGHTLDNPAVSDERPVPELLPTLSSWFERVVNGAKPK
jgi:hypothetical protein